MLQMIGFDLDSSAERGFDPSQALEKGVRECGTGLNFRWGPWLLDTKKSPRRVLEILKRRLNGEGLDDYLLVVPVKVGTFGAPKKAKRNPRPKEIKKIAKGKRVIAIAYRMYHAKGKDYRAVSKAMKRLFDKPYNPAHTLWFVSTDKSVKKVRTQIDKVVPLSCCDDLLVVEVQRGRGGVYSKLETPETGGRGEWLRSHRVAAEAH